MEKVEIKTIQTKWTETILFRFEKEGVIYAVLFCAECLSCCRLELPKDEKQLAPETCEKPKKEITVSDQRTL